MKAKIIFDSECWKALKVLQNLPTTSQSTKSGNNDVRKDGKKWEEGGSPPGRGRGKGYKVVGQKLCS